MIQTAFQLIQKFVFEKEIKGTLQNIRVNAKLFQ